MTGATARRLLLAGLLFALVACDRTDNAPPVDSPLPADGASPDGDDRPRRPRVATPNDATPADVEPADATDDLSTEQADVRALLRRLPEPDAARALLALGPEVVPLVSDLATESKWVRRDAMRLLRLRPSQTLDHLRPWLTHADPKHRTVAAHAVSDLVDWWAETDVAPDIVDELASGLAASEGDERRLRLEGIARCPAHAARALEDIRPTLERLQADPDEEVSRLARLALQNRAQSGRPDLDRGPPPVPLDEEASDPHRSSRVTPVGWGFSEQRNTDPAAAEVEVRVAALEALAARGDATPTQLERIDASLDDPSPHVRIAAAEALCRTTRQTRRALAVLQAELDLPAPGWSWSIGLPPRPRGETDYADLETHWAAAARAVARIGPDAAPLARPLAWAALRQNEPSLQRIVVESIRTIGPDARATLPLLRRMWARSHTHRGKYSVAAQLQEELARCVAVLESPVELAAEKR